MEMNIIIPTEIQSANRLLRMHFQARKRLLWAFMLEIRAAGIDPPARAKKVRNIVRITSYRKRRLDEDNLVGGAKLCLDAIKKLGLIYNDSPKWILLQVLQEIDSKNPRTKIEIFET